MLQRLISLFDVSYLHSMIKIVTQLRTMLSVNMKIATMQLTIMNFIKPFKKVTALILRCVLLCLLVMLSPPLH